MLALAGIRRVDLNATELGAGALLDNRYEVLALIGEGGFGRVYAARDQLRGREVAIKVLALAYGGGGDQAIARFVREAEITASLVHGNTVRVFDWGMTHDGQLFLIMERLRGESLRNRLDRARLDGRTLGDHETHAIAMQVLQSLAEAHASGLVHRDLKPGNIYLHRLAGRTEVVKVIDFGIARQSGSEMTRAGQALGTPTHMSPEQAQGHVIDGRSDLYSLAVVMYECLVGEMPFYDPDSALLTMMMHVTRPIPDLVAEAPVPVTQALAAVVVRGLAKSPDERLGDATAMRAALKAVGLPRRPSARTGGGPLPARYSTPRQDRVERRLPRRVSDVVSTRARPIPNVTPIAGPPSSGPPSSGPPNSGPPSTQSPGSGSPPAVPPFAPVTASEPVDVAVVASGAGKVRGQRRRMLHAADTQRLVDRNEKEK